MAQVFRSPWLFLWACVGLATLASSTVLAQAPGQIAQLNNLAGKPVNLAQFMNNNPRGLQQLRSSLLGVMQAGKTATPLEADQFETYILGRIADLTWPGTVSNDEKRMNLKREARQLSLAPSMELHDRLNQIFLVQMPVIAADSKLDLDARYNALILLGQVDRVEPNFAAGQAAVPLAEVTPLLIGAFEKQDLPESLRIAALVGLARQSELQIISGTRLPIGTVAAKLIVAKQPLAGFSAAGHHWARKLALQIVVGLSKTGSELDRPETVKALYDILADANEPLFLRRDAALALGNLAPATLAGGSVKPVDMVRALSLFTVQLMRAGGLRNDPTAEPKLNIAEDVFLPPNEDNKKLFAEGLSYYLNCVATALGGRNTRGIKAVPGLDQETRGLAEGLLNSHVDQAVLAMGNSRIIASQLPVDLADRGAKLEQWMSTNALGTKAMAAAPADR